VTQIRKSKRKFIARATFAEDFHANVSLQFELLLSWHNVIAIALYEASTIASLKESVRRLCELF
jgi:hypothetical protein